MFDWFWNYLDVSTSPERARHIYELAVAFINDEDATPDSVIPVNSGKVESYKLYRVFSQQVDFELHIHKNAFGYIELLDLQSVKEGFNRPLCLIKVEPKKSRCTFLYLAGNSTYDAKYALSWASYTTKPYKQNDHDTQPTSNSEPSPTTGDPEGKLG